MFSNNAYNFEVVKMKLHVVISVCAILGLLLVDTTDSVMPDNPIPNPDPDVVQGDIKVDSRMREMMRQGMNFETYPFNYWPSGTEIINGEEVQVKALVKFSVSPDYGFWAEPIIRKAVDEWNDQVGKCVYWHQVPGFCRSDRFCVQMAPISGCSSRIGKLDGLSNGPEPQDLSLTSSCLLAGDPQITIMHEMEHAIGMDHEHIRADRDQYIEVDEKLVKEKGVESQFDFLPFGQRILLGPYDVYSIMHYNLQGAAYFKVKDPTVDLSRVGRGRNNATTFTELDIKKIKMLYNCTD